MTADRWLTSYRQLNSLGILNSGFDPATSFSLKFAQ